MFKRKNYFALGAVVLVTLAIFSLPPRAASRLKLAVGSLFLPLFGLANAAQQASVSVADAIMPRRELLKKLGSLEQENQQLKILQLQSSEIARENDQLRAANRLAEADAVEAETGERRHARPGELVAHRAD